MAMETVVGLAMATGRTLVLPPQKKMYLLGKGGGKDKKHFDFDDFFPMKQMAEENAALEMITMKEFLDTEAMTGNLIEKETGKPSFPPENRTDWDGLSNPEYDILREWLRTVSLVPEWRPGQCLATFPSHGNHKSIEELKVMQAAIHKEGQDLEKIYKNNPADVDSTPIERMKENLAGRKDLCVYDESMQNELVRSFSWFPTFPVSVRSLFNSPFLLLLYIGGSLCLLSQDEATATCPLLCILVYGRLAGGSLVKTFYARPHALQ